MFWNKKKDEPKGREAEMKKIVEIMMGHGKYTSVSWEGEEILKWTDKYGRNLRVNVLKCEPRMLRGTVWYVGHDEGDMYLDGYTSPDMANEVGATPGREGELLMLLEYMKMPRMV